MAQDKKQAIQQMIQLDYNNENELFTFINAAEYFESSLQSYKSEFEKLQPIVVGMEQFENGSQNVSSSIKIIAINFSQPMDTLSTVFNFGPLGESNVLRVQKVIGFSGDRKSFSFEVMLEPGKQYQSVATENFTSQSGYPLKPFLINFKTAK